MQRESVRWRTFLETNLDNLSVRSGSGIAHGRLAQTHFLSLERRVAVEATISNRVTRVPWNKGN